MTTDLEKLNNYRNIRLGWRPQLPDHRDIWYSDRHPLKSAVLPSVVDLRKWFPEVNYQGSLGSCVAQASTDALEYLELRQGKPLLNLSRLQLYYDARTEADKDYDNGCVIRDAFKCMNSIGVGSEDLWSYDIYSFNVPPPAAVYEDAKNHQAVEYLAVEQNFQIRQVLAEGFPVVFGMTICDSFYTPIYGPNGEGSPGSDGWVRIPHDGERICGGHCMLICGYFQETQAYIVRNSWAEDWGDKGYCYIPFELVEDNGFCSDFWVVKKEGTPPPTPRPTTVCGKTKAAGRRLSTAWKALKGEL